MTDITPCWAFVNKLTPAEQLQKVLEEVGEINTALRDYQDDPEDSIKFGALAEEIVDAQVALETRLAIVGLDAEGRDAVRGTVYEKNLKREYYKRAY